MSADARTIGVYDARAGDYSRLTKDLDGYNELVAFAASMPMGARVLDLGCGPGLYATYFAEMGISVDATDASPEMVRLTGKISGVNARLATFNDIKVADTYDGIWANFSLLHAPHTDFPKHLAALHRACKPKALLHLGMKLGSGEGRDKLGRLYAYYNEDELIDHLIDAGFTTENCTHGRGPGLDGTVSDWILISAHA